MQQEIRFATFNVCNLAPPGAKLYDNLEPLTAEQYASKVKWTAAQLDELDADVIGLQEVFAPEALRDVLARSRRYRGAAHACSPADPAAERLVPGVALVSRLPLVAPVAFFATFPAGVAMPAGSRDADRFARAPLHATLALADGRALDVIVVHLKSRRPDYRNGDGGDDPLLAGMAELRSLIRRGTEAVALRVLLADLARAGRPRVVLGDFNDVANAVTTCIVLGAGGEPGQQAPGRMFDCRQIQSCRDSLRHLGYTNIHDGQAMTIDHILVSEEFNPASPGAIGEVLDVSYLNDHLLQELPQASDHGQVLARVRLFAAVNQ